MKLSRSAIMLDVPLCEGERILGKGIRDVASGGIKIS